MPLRAWERRLEILREFGVNAIRTAHNPPAPEFLDLTDRMGFIVMDETFDAWTVKKREHDYHRYFNEWSKIDTRDTVRRDRNHPSVVVYSAGNEIHDTPKAELAKRILAGLVEVFHEHDPTRPVTQGLFRPNVSKDYDNGLADLLDVVGQNYRENEILAAHRQKPSRKILGTENTHTREAWLALRDNPPYAGQFLWSGIDYLGESPGWPMISENFGILDRTATPRPYAFQRQSWWSREADGARHAPRRAHAGPADRPRLRFRPPPASPVLRLDAARPRRRTKRPSRSIATASRSSCCSTASRSARRRDPRTTPRASGKSPSSRARSAPSARTAARPSPRTSCAPPGSPRASSSP